MTSCIDKDEPVDSDHKPASLGGSIYEELKNPNPDHLTGTFKTYLRLVDDLNYSSTLSRTGSKTVFPANDEAFERFFQSNKWGVTSYEELSNSQKKLLLYSSMIDNALLVGMLSNVSGGTDGITAGLGLKHPTSVSVIDSIAHYYDPTQMPANNSWWKKYFKTGIDVVCDNTRPMMVHFTREQMVNNNITTIGDNSDFSILTGEAYDEASKPAYIFNDRIINRDVTCMNGYIQQLQDVLLPPGNMAQVLRDENETSIFSRMLDYFAAPYYDAATTNQYNDWAVANNAPLKDSIFQVRYLSSRSQNASLVVDPSGNTMGQGRYLTYDPGWNQYYPAHANTSSIDYSITDMGAMFVPCDAAIKKYFLPGGNGAFLIDIYGSKENTEANLLENLDSMYVKNPQVISAFIKNLQKNSFVETVPSKFESIINDASENMGMNLGYLKQTSDGKYDIKIANNGVIYILNDMIAPDEYQAVLAPASSYPDMRIMNWAIQDRKYLGVDFKFYLLAMSANYAFFIPEDEAFNAYYIDPTSLGHAKPEVLHFYYDEKKNPAVRCDRYYYDVASGTLGERIGEVSDITQRSSQLVDILNYHTVLLESGEEFGHNKYYKTKHGGEICLQGNGQAGSSIVSGAQIDNGAAPSVIKAVYNEKNGKAFRISNIIQAPQNSVAKTLKNNDQFSEFYEACSGFSATDILKWAGISDETNSFGTTEQDQYIIFTSTYGTGKNAIKKACLDENVKMFNTYNYTLYAPDNAAMEEAYANGLPRWSDIQALFEKYGDEAPDNVRAEVLEQIKAIKEFVRYHFQSISLYADKTVEGGTYQTLATNELGLAREIKISGGNDKIVVTDGANIQHVVDANASGKVANAMARDYWFNNSAQSATAITTSSFCAVHEISKPFYLFKDSYGNPTWKPSVVNAGAKAHGAKRK